MVFLKYERRRYGLKPCNALTNGKIIAETDPFVKSFVKKSRKFLGIDILKA